MQHRLCYLNMVHIYWFKCVKDVLHCTHTHTNQYIYQIDQQRTTMENPFINKMCNFRTYQYYYYYYWIASEKYRHGCLRIYRWRRRCSRSYFCLGRPQNNYVFCILVTSAADSFIFVWNWTTDYLLTNKQTKSGNCGAELQFSHRFVTASKWLFSCCHCGMELYTLSRRRHSDYIIS